MAGTWLGGCQCGEVRYEVESAHVLTLYCCHCRDCQRQSASAFGMSLRMPRTALRLVRGTLKTWEHRCDRGAIKRGHFYPTCGVRIFHDGGEMNPVISLKAGSLDNTDVLRPVGHIWTKSAQRWVPVPEGVLVYEGQPDTAEDLYAAYRGQSVR